MTSPGTATPISEWAARYITTFNLALVPIEPGEKAPKGNGWNKPGGYFTEADQAAAFWQSHPSHNMGVVLGPSRVCSLDVDDVQWTRFVLFDQLGLDLDAMALVFPTVVGNPARFRILFQVPAGAELSRHSLSWPNEHDPDGSLFKAAMERAKAAKAAGDTAAEAAARAEADELKKFTVFELRGGLVQDVLPPSIHPGTGKPYTWRTPPAADGLPVLTADLLAIWQNWDAFKRDAEAACPWRPKAEPPAAKKVTKPAARQGDRPKVIDAFNQAHDVESLLAAHGYAKKGRKWLCPHSSSGLPGITITEGRMYSHHGSDPLANGHQNDAFDVFCLLEHNGDQGAAVKAAAKVLGLDMPARPPRAPSDEGGSAAPQAAAPEGAGEGAVWDDGKLLKRFALVEGDTKVFDTKKHMLMKRTAFEAMVTKPLAKVWFDSAAKMSIAADQAKRWLEQKALNGKVAKGGGMAATARYVLIDGTRDIWDVEKRRRIPADALRLVLGDSFPLWLNSTERRTVDMDHLVFDPTMTKDPAVYINTFEGLPLIPSDDHGKCKAIIEVVRFLCNGDADAMHYLLCWLALPLQVLGTKMATAVLMHSTMEGSGKSLLLSDIMREIYGQYGATVGQAQLESSWSAWQSNKLYGVFEEVVSRDQRYNQVGKIKHMITGKTFRIESKFMNGWEETNYMNALFLSNEILPWPISENDRRLLVIWPEDTMLPSLQQRVVAEMDGGGIEAFYGYLLNYPVGDFHAHTRPPKTAARQRLVELSMASWQTFISEWRLNLLGVPFETCVSSDLYSLFCEWCKRGGEHSLSHTKFSGFVGSQIPKEKGLPWSNGMKRAFGTFFFPSPPPSVSSAELGKAVDKFRTAARSAGWDVDNWDHMRGRAPAREAA